MPSKSPPSPGILRTPAASHRKFLPPWRRPRLRSESAASRSRLTVQPLPRPPALTSTDPRPASLGPHEPVPPVSLPGPDRCAELGSAFPLPLRSGSRRLQSLPDCRLVADTRTPHSGFPVVRSRARLLSAFRQEPRSSPDIPPPASQFHWSDLPRNTILPADRWSAERRTHRQ